MLVRDNPDNRSVYMELFTRTDMYKLGIILLQFIGENFKHTRSKLVLYRCFNYVVFVTLILFTAANFLQVESGLYVKTLQSLISVVHVLLKYSLFIYYKSDIDLVLNISSKNFWTGDEFNGNISKTLAVRYKIVQFVQLGAIGISIIGVLSYCLRPVLISDAIFILETWIFIDSSLLAGIVLMCQYYYFSVIMSVTLGYDFIYMSLCIDVISQMELLKFKISQILSDNVENVTIELYNCIRHHQILLSVFRRMRNIYSLMLLFHYFVTLIGTCASFYEFLGKADLPGFIINFATVSVLFLEFGCYTFPAEQVALEFFDLLNFIYMSKWYKSSNRIQKMVLFMMTQAHRQLYFSGGGIININVDTFGSVVKKTFSFYTILRNVFN